MKNALCIQHLTFNIQHSIFVILALCASDRVPIEELTGELVCAASRSLLRGTGGAKASLN